MEPSKCNSSVKLGTDTIKRKLHILKVQKIGEEGIQIMFYFLELNEGLWCFSVDNKVSLPGVDLFWSGL